MKSGSRPVDEIRRAGRRGLGILRLGTNVNIEAMIWSRRPSLRAGWTDERGASYVEYAFLLVLIAVVCIAAVTFFGNATSASLDSSASRL